MTGTKRPHPAGSRVGENHRPPRYRLLAAAAALPRRKAVEPSECFERECPACGRPVLFTQTQATGGVDYSIEEHDCNERVAR